MATLSPPSLVPKARSGQDIYDSGGCSSSSRYLSQVQLGRNANGTTWHLCFNGNIINTIAVELLDNMSKLAIVSMKLYGGRTTYFTIYRVIIASIGNA